MLKVLCVALFTSVLTSANVLMLSSVTIKPAYSQNNATINYFKQGYQRAYAGWSNFNSEERAMDKRIELALTNAGMRSIPVTDQNLIWMIQQINASPDLYTAGFIAGRMSVLAQATQTFDQTDSLLCSIGNQFGISAGKAYC
ncbi:MULTISPECIES: hypothetical protein [Nostocales]|uniref:Uncharacterized protein n=1 Tax=Dolichospermum flos-aquae UHCC 0037 TaxID=2590026 RepID=A0ACC7S2M0_DOLFA|nr:MULTISPECIES: hypothetical protein [Nostocales]MBO1066894.1 hypothetical protein [Anabaena sp. 54]MCX5982066.1 hypothetical protein [Nostocales cyanobacterium LacPavin_0920_SED1_MAG_38_18]MTJ42599.1 hypothetical protein [Dolichospermum flos-aquae UHCC 0037]OBQ22482.1 MAG: hypothetical protein AN486_02265 [Anabaena sp. AL93]